MSPPHPASVAVRPVDAGMVQAATQALADAGTAGFVAVLDLDRLHLLTPGFARAGDALHAVLERIGDHLRGRAPWLRLDTDVIVVVAPAVADQAAAVAMCTELVGVVERALADAAPDLPVRPACGVAWLEPATTALLGAALDACSRSRHEGPPVVLADLWVREQPLPVGSKSGAAPSVADRRSEIDGFLVELSGQALGLDPGTFVDALPRVLGQLAMVAGADYAFVDVMGPGGTTVQNLAGWSDDAHPGFVRNEERPLVRGDEWHRMLVALEPVVVNDQFASHGGEHPANHPSGGVARSFITIPFVVGGQLAGALGVGSIDRLRPWSADEVTALRLTTGLVAAVLERDRLARQADA